MNFLRRAIKLSSNNFPRRFSTSTGTPTKDDSISRKDMIFLGSIIVSALGIAYNIAGMAYNLDCKISNLDSKFDNKIGNLDGKIGSNSDKSDAKFESLRSELGSNRSELLNAISNAQGERIKALEVAAAERKKYW